MGKGFKKFSKGVRKFRKKVAESDLIEGGMNLSEAVIGGLGILPAGEPFPRALISKKIRRKSIV